MEPLDDLSGMQERIPPFGKVLGIRLVEVSPERLVAELEVRADLCTNPPVMHGGAIMALADTLGAVATVLNLAEGMGTTTLESKTNFIGPAPVGETVRAECAPIHRGRRTQIWQTRITTAAGKLVAVVTQTQFVIEPPR